MEMQYENRKNCLTLLPNTSGQVPGTHFLLLYNRAVGLELDSRYVSILTFYYFTKVELQREVFPGNKFTEPYFTPEIKDSDCNVLSEL